MFFIRQRIHAQMVSLTDEIMDAVDDDVAERVMTRKQAMEWWLVYFPTEERDAHGEGRFIKNEPWHDYLDDGWYGARDARLAAVPA